MEDSGKQGLSCFIPPCHLILLQQFRQLNGNRHKVPDPTAGQADTFLPLDGEKVIGMV